MLIARPARVGVASSTPCTSPARTGRLQAIDFTFNLTDTYTFWSGMIGGTVPDAVVFRLRSEPGAALSHGEVGGGGPSVADDERLREDPAAGADPADRRAGLRLLPVRAAADAVQPGARDGVADGPPQGSDTPRSKRRFDGALPMRARGGDGLAVRAAHRQCRTIAGSRQRSRRPTGAAGAAPGGGAGEARRAGHAPTTTSTTCSRRL